MDTSSVADQILFAEGFSGNGQRYSYGKTDLWDVINEIETPSYIYFIDILRNKVETLKKFSKSVNSAATELFYSVKANPGVHILQAVLESGLNVEVSSIGELKHVLNIGFTPERIILLGPAKDEALIRKASEIHIKGVIAESFRELDLIEKHYDGQMIVMVRLNMEDETTQALESMSGSESKFGIDINNMKEIIQRSGFVPDGKFGFQYYLGSQVLDFRESLRLHEKMLGYMKSFRERISYIDLGGGFGVPMNSQDLPFDFQSFSVGLNTLLSKYGLAEKTIWFESGRFIVADSGVFVTRIIDIKTAGNGSTIVTTDGGMNDFLRIAFLGAEHPIRLISRENCSKRKLVTVCGPLCTPIDCFGRNIPSPECIKEGDVVMVFKTGAYGLSMSPILFLLQKTPGEYAFSEGKLQGRSYAPLSADTIMNFIYRQGVRN
ncbi:Diaminopimelate decarboxylase [Thermoplasmatales archaeon]|nr:Diaminopimelate decarboxylase [Thermoplasmatales archaeon]